MTRKSPPPPFSTVSNSLERKIPPSSIFSSLPYVRECEASQKSPPPFLLVSSSFYYHYYIHATRDLAPLLPPSQAANQPNSHMSLDEKSFFPPPCPTAPHRLPPPPSDAKFKPSQATFAPFPRRKYTRKKKGGGEAEKEPFSRYLKRILLQGHAYRFSQDHHSPTEKTTRDAQKGKKRK